MLPDSSAELSNSPKFIESPVLRKPEEENLFFSIERIEKMFMSPILSPKERESTHHSLWHQYVTKAKLNIIIDETSLRHHFGNSHLRWDQWNELEVLASKCPTHENLPPPPSVLKRIQTIISSLKPIESFFAFPGRKVFHDVELLVKEAKFTQLEHLVSKICHSLANYTYKYKSHNQILAQNFVQKENDQIISKDNFNERVLRVSEKPYFEILIVLSPCVDFGEEDDWNQFLSKTRHSEDKYIYEPVFVYSYQDALGAVLLNENLQAVIVGTNFPYKSQYPMDFIPINKNRFPKDDADSLVLVTSLSENLKSLQPNLNLYHFTKLALETVALLQTKFRRIFYSEESKGVLQELHLSILEGVHERFHTPFFDALKKYSTHPTGVFHALPISRGSSLTHSHWAHDMYEFYGKSIFMAETSSTSGGLDSLLDPTGPIKEAQTLAAKTFGSDYTFWVTNGTSTANKIVLQAITKPGDIVLIDRNCHKSHHYGAILVGASVKYLDAYPLPQYAMYGGVSLRTIKQTLLDYKKAGTLNKVKLLLLTNCTFDGIVYNVMRVMQECLAIKPDLIFLWDEAWWAFARFHPITRLRTAMRSAKNLHRYFRSEPYKEQYEKWYNSFKTQKLEDDETWLNNELFPDPSKVRIRVYATQSTHKTLTAFRQGSMIHIYDQDFRRLVDDSWKEAFYTHTSTSPNYQILSSLDVGRRQVALEGYDLVNKQIERAMVIREQCLHNKEISSYFTIADVIDLIPEEFRKTGLVNYIPSKKVDWNINGFNSMFEAWTHDEFVLDPCRITLVTSKAGIDGDTFKNKILMDQWEIQVNKTSINSVLFMTTIGTTRSSVAYLLESLVKTTRYLQRDLDSANTIETKQHEKRVAHLTTGLPPLPNFSRFHKNYEKNPETKEGQIREAFYDAYDEENCEYIPLKDPSWDEKKREYVAANFVIPYPPGFPILVPGQVISFDVISFMRSIDVKEIHGYKPEFGIHVFTEEFLQKQT